MLLRLRQACDHPILVSKSFASDPDALVPKVPNEVEDKDEADELADLFGGLGVAKAPKCTICSAVLAKDQTTFCSDGCEKLSRRARDGSVEGTEAVPSSAKIREIQRILKDVGAKGEGDEKTISQYTRDAARRSEVDWARADTAPSLSCLDSLLAVYDHARHHRTLPQEGRTQVCAM